MIIHLGYDHTIRLIKPLGYDHTIRLIKPFGYDHTIWIYFTILTNMMQS